MGSCFSSLEGLQKEDVEEVKPDCIGNEKTRKENTPTAISSGVCLSGASASRVAFLYTLQGTRSKKKNVNQDAMLVWEVSIDDFDGPPYAYASVLKRMSFAEITSTSSDEEWSKPLDTNELKKLPEKHLKLKHALLKAFKLMNEELKILHPEIDASESGSTAVTLIKQGRDLVIGNVGDSRAVLGTRDKGNALVAIQLTVDLKPELPRETARIEKHGGKVLPDKRGVKRFYAKNVKWSLAMSRAFGDFELEEYGLISVPEISYHQITQRDEFIIVATDGVWNKLSNEEAVAIVASTPCRGAAAKALVDCARRAWNQSSAHHRDDCTAVCLFLDSCTTTSRGTAGWKS